MWRHIMHENPSVAAPSPKPQPPLSGLWTSGFDPSGFASPVPHSKNYFRRRCCGVVRKQMEYCVVECTSKKNFENKRRNSSRTYSKMRIHIHIQRIVSRVAISSVTILPIFPNTALAER